MAPPLYRALDELTHATDQLLAEVAALTDPNRPPTEGGWSGTQVIRHLLGAEAGILALLDKQARKPAADLPVGGVASWFRSRLMSWQLRRPEKRFKAPARLGEPTADAADLAELRATWAELRARLRTLIEKWPTSHSGRAVFQHPRAGWLTLGQTLRFMTDHVHHHRQQVARLGASR